MSKIDTLVKRVSKLIDSLSELNLSIDGLESEHAISKSKLKENQLQIESIEIEIMKLTDVLGVLISYPFVCILKSYKTIQRNWTIHPLRISIFNHSHIIIPI